MSCLTAIKLKRGGSLSLLHSITITTSEGADKDLTGWTITALVKYGAQELGYFTVVYLNVEQGLVQLVFEDTSEWPIGSMSFDVKYVLPSGHVYYSPTMTISCAERITP
jgi:hypothetical protein